MGKKSTKVLIVEDESVTRKLLASVVAANADVTEAKDGEEALVLFRQAIDTGEPFQFVLLDIAMPKRDGVDTLIAIRAIEQESGIAEEHLVKTLMITASPNKSDVADVRHFGCQDVLRKPVDPLLILERLQAQGFPK